jgi:alpha-glucosidase (family GH31 glycosyl hydrolase)
MTQRLSRRKLLKQFAAASAGLVAADGIIRGQSADIVIGGQPVEIAVTSLSPSTVRVTVRPVRNGQPSPIVTTGALDREEFGAALAEARSAAGLTRVRAGNLVVSYAPGPPAIHVGTTAGEVVQTLTFDAATPGMTFLLPQGPLLGLGEGGPQFDRKGTTDQMRNGQVTSRADGYGLATHGTRAPVQWLIGAAGGWAMFIHQPYGTFDFKGTEGRFSMPVPAVSPAATSVVNAPPAGAAPFLPLDLFVVASRDPKVILREYARITGLPEMPALWTFGYQQSHRTLDGRDQILGVAKTFRDKKLPCDALIYLGTEFAPSGWNTRNGEFAWHATNFPDPKKMIDELHADHFKVVLHIVIEGRTLTGGVSDPCTAPALPSGRTPENQWPPDRQASCYWPAHKPLMDVGVDGWWPDQGDGFDGPSRLNRHRMYWEGTQLYRPNERPFALHRNASPGVQRFGGFIWSGDVQSRWETLKTHVPVAINTSLSGLPYWGTDIGGFYATAEYTGELYVRWFQFAAFCPLFRAHGRNWHLHTPWGWDGGDGGPPETQGFRADPAELHNANIEPIVRKYLELRYRLLPYLYTAVRECHDTGLPIMRALWLHDPSDAAAVARGDQYMWGPDILVAPVVEKGATSRRLYLPRGTWHDFWTDTKFDGGREIDRPIDLATMPLYVRAGAVIPMGPVKQYADEAVDEPLTLVVYPGANGSASVYEDDGRSFAYRQGAYMRLSLTWQDATRQLSLGLAPGSRMLPPARRTLNVRVAGSTATTPVTFTGAPVTVRV